MNKIIKACLPDAAAIIGFLLIAFVYFFTPVTQGLVLTGHDHSGGIGAGKELTDHREKTGELSRWTNSLFGGMPTYQMAPSYKSGTTLMGIEKVYRLGLSGCVMYVFVYLLGFYILLRAFNFKVWMAALGAIIWAFSSYFFIIITAGHIWKVMTLAFVPPTIAGMILCYRGKYLWGTAVTAIFAALQILSNHIQMSYYFLFLMLFIVIAYYFDALKKKSVKSYFKSTGLLLVAGILALAANLPNLYHTYQYSKESMRGKAPLVLNGQTSNPSSEKKQGSGLSREYITQWSYGIGETLSLMVPNVKGGGSVPLAANTKAMEKSNPNYRQIFAQLSQYWGEQPGTVGPVYVGAFVCFLFILGLFIVRHPIKWALLAGTLLSFFMAWGHNWMGFTDFMIDNIPLYNKFRTVSSALVVAEFTIPLLAILALVEFIKNPSLLETRKVAFGSSLALTAGVAALLWLVPDVFFNTYASSNELASLRHFISDPNVLNPLLENLFDVRRSILTADAGRSLFIILLGVAFLVLYSNKKIKSKVLVGLIIGLCLIDMWQIDKRYLNDGLFKDPIQKTQLFKPTAVDNAILQDKSLSYRVLNMSTNTFNENNTSYYHKSIGGYSAVKLRSYQDLIDHALRPEMDLLKYKVVEVNGDLSKANMDSICPVLNMLNMKYLIFPGGDNTIFPMINPEANGNAWFVQSVEYVNSDAAEMRRLLKIDNKKVAVAQNQYKEILGDGTSGEGTVEMTQYAANELSYNIQSDKGGVIVLSEIYYPGWTATLDGQTIDIAKVNYLLRAVKVPAGKHTLHLEFRPVSITTTEIIAFSSLFLILVVFVIAFMRKRICKKCKA